MDYGKPYEVEPGPDDYGWTLKGKKCNYESAAEAIWYDEFHFCGCGDPEEAMKFIAEMLKLQKAGGYEDFKKLIAENLDTVDLMLRYFLDAHELTEHGGSVYGAWLTERGKQVSELFSTVVIEDD